jgi:hypothetical protein
MRLRTSLVGSIIACLTLFGGLSGTAMGASNHLVASATQIMPSTLETPKDSDSVGPRGRRGHPGLIGPHGALGVLPTEVVNAADRWPVADP